METLIAANDNFEIKTEIPAEKIAARAMLNDLGVGASVSITVACDNANLPVERGWRGEPQDAPEPKRWTPSKRKAANDNRELLSWPLLAYLHRQGRRDDAEIVENYYGLVALMEAEPLQGQAPTRSDGLTHEARSSIDKDAVDKAAAAGWPSGNVPNGSICYKEERQLVKAPGGSSRARPTDEDTKTVMRPMALRFTERTLIAQIDMRGVLPRLRAALGPLVAPFEDAVLGGMTFGSLGEARHFKGKQAEAAGKALVMAAIDAVTNEWAKINYERRKAAEQAERNVDRRRAELAAQQASYFRRAA